MTQGELEKLPREIVRQMTSLEMRIMEDIVNRIKENGFSPATSDWEITRLQQLGMSWDTIEEYIKQALEATDEQLDTIFSDDVYEQYYGHARAYETMGCKQIPYEKNKPLQQFVEAVKRQTKDTFRNLTASTGFAMKSKATGKVFTEDIRTYYTNTLDRAMYDIHSGAFSYDRVLQRTVKELTASGLRTIEYISTNGRYTSTRVDVAARRAVMTGFRQIQGQINQQVAEDLHTDYYEVTYHVGARPTHQPWQGRVYSMAGLKKVCGLGAVDGLHGVNCYHDYSAFIPGVSVRTYTDEELDAMNAKDNELRTVNGNQYTTYEALQEQRRMERGMRATRQRIDLLREGEADDETLLLTRCKYEAQFQAYQDFSDQAGLPTQYDRVNQDGLSGRFRPTAAEMAKAEKSEDEESKGKIQYSETIVDKKIIESAGYRRKINAVSSSTEANRSVYQAAKKILTHRSGTKYEDLAFVDSGTGKSEVNMSYSVESTASMNKAQKKMLKEAEPYTIIGIHNHPGSSVPSLGDIMTCYQRKYKCGIVLCHNGDIYKYSVKEAKFNTMMAFFSLERTQKKGYTAETIELLRDAGIEMEKL